MVLKKQSTLDNNSARNIAANSLLAFQQRQQRIQESLNDIFSSGELDSRDRRLGHELACGVCRYLITLDHLISKHSNRGIRKIDPILLQILRVGLYQLVYLERTPDFAAVHQAVEQARETGIRGGETFVNAVLRSIQRDMEGPLTSDNATGPVLRFGAMNNTPVSSKAIFYPIRAKDRRNIIAWVSAIHFG